MTQFTPTDNLLEVVQETKEFLGSVRVNVVYIARNLAFLRENDKRPWAEVLEELDVSQGFASKLVSMYTHFVLEGGLDPQDIMDIDAEKLYLAGRTQGSVEEQLSRAKTLTRGELKLEKSENEPHSPDFKEVCVHPNCWLTKENHP